MDEKYLETAELHSAAEATEGLAKIQRDLVRTQMKPKDFDGTCTCGEEIPPERVALKYYNCVVCQGQKEDRRFGPR